MKPQITLYSRYFGSFGTIPGIAGTAWLPNSEATFSDWYSGTDDASLTTANGNVTAWNSSSSSTNVLATATGTPTHSNTLDCVDFGAAARSLADTSVGNGALTNGACCFVCVADVSKTISSFIFNQDIAGANPGMALWYDFATNAFRVYCNSATSGGNISKSATAYTAGTKFLMTVISNGVTGLSYSWFGTLTSGGVATPFTSTRLMLGRSLAGLNKVYDLMSFSTNSTTVYQKAEGFLAWKHGLTLASGHPFEFAAP